MKREDVLFYAITDRSGLPDISLYEAVEQALLGGVTILQLREKKMDEEMLRQEIPPILALCRRHGVPLILDDHVALAKELGCDGVHIGQNDMPAVKARQILGKDKILGVTAKTVAQARAAEAAGADYLGSGAMFATATKPGAVPITPERFAEIAASVHIPVVAIGGITAENISDLYGLGAAGIAVSAAVFRQKDIRAASENLKKKAQGIVNVKKS